MSNNRNEILNKKRKQESALDSKESKSLSAPRYFKSHMDYELVAEEGSLLKPHSFTVILHDRPSRSEYQGFRERLINQNITQVEMDLTGDFVKIKINLKCDTSVFTYADKISDQMFREALGVANTCQLKTSDLEKILREYQQFLAKNKMQSYFDQSAKQHGGNINQSAPGRAF